MKIFNLWACLEWVVRGFCFGFGALVALIVVRVLVGGV